jgi:hypothetical protein
MAWRGGSWEATSGWRGGDDVYAPLSGDVTAPTVLSATISSNGLNITIAFSEPVTGSLGFSLDMSGGPVTMTYAGGSGTGFLSYTLSRTIFVDETGTLAYADGDVEDLAGNPLLPMSISVIRVEDVAPPVLIRASVTSDGLSLHLWFDEPVTGSNGFEIWFDGGDIYADFVGGEFSRLLVYSLSRQVRGVEVGRITYSTGNVVDLSDNALMPLAAQILNGSLVQDPERFDFDGKGQKTGAQWVTASVLSNQLVLPGNEDDPQRDVDGALVFGDDDVVSIGYQLANGWVEGSDLFPFVRWLRMAPGNDPVVWQVRYRWANNGGSFSGWSDVRTFNRVRGSDAGIPGQNLITALGQIRIPTGRMGMILQLEVTRMDSGEPVKVLSINLNQQLNQFGSDLQYQKYADELTYKQ